MLFRILSSASSVGEAIVILLMSLFALVPALTVHEWAHGYIAYKLGDRTAKLDGRLSLNPLDHIDPVGALLLLVAGFGWARPVPVNTRNFRKPKRDIALTSAAGPIANFILAFLGVFFYTLSVYICFYFDVPEVTGTVICWVFYLSALYNLGLGLFNLIPLPPLDGSNILVAFLPQRLAVKYLQLRYYAPYIFIGIIILSRLPLNIDLFAPLNALENWIFNGFYELCVKMIAPFFEFI